MSTDVPSQLPHGWSTELADEETRATSAAPTPPPNRIGPYQIVELLGKDACGVMCLARDVRSDVEVELRLLPLMVSRDRKAVKRLREVAATARTIRHAGIVPLLAFDRDPDRPDLVYVVHEHVPGTRLVELVEQGGERLNVDRVIGWADHLAEAIDDLHEHGMVHGAVGTDTVVIGHDDRPRLSSAVILREVRRLAARIGPARPNSAGNDGGAVAAKRRRRRAP